MVESYLFTKSGITTVICSTVSENTFMDRRMTDVCTMALALLTQSSRAKKCHYNVTAINGFIVSQEQNVLLSVQWRLS